MATSSYQPSFAGGELSPDLRRRVDLEKYAIGAESIENMIVLSQGGVQARTGTKYICEIKDSTNNAYLRDFVFSITQAYQLEFGDYYIRFIMDGGQIIMDSTTTSAWVTATAYTVYTYVIVDSLVYRCILAHTSTSTDQPGTGTNWATYWVQNNIYEIATPYALADIPKLKTEQSADTMYITGSGYAPRKLARTAHTAWTLTSAAFTNGPLMTENDTDTTITLSNTAGDTWIYEDAAVTATASSAIFNSSHVGSIWGIRYRAYAATYTGSLPGTSSAFRAIGDWTCTIKPDSSAQLDYYPTYIQKSVDEGTTWFTIETVTYQSGDTSVNAVTGSEDDECLLRITHATAPDAGTYSFEITGKLMWGTFKITAYTSSAVVTGVMQTNFSQGGSAYKSWAEGAWSDYRGWPYCVSFFQNRLVFGGNDYAPNTYWASCIDDYLNFEIEIPQVDDDAITDRLLARRVNSINWLVPTRALVALTSDSEWSISPGSTGAFTYESKIVTAQTFFGSDGTVKPVVAGEVILFLQRNAAKVRSLGYSYDIDGYTGNEMSILASHLFDGYTIISWAFQQYPNSILWAVRSDGELLSFTFHKEHDVWAWCHHVTDGTFENVSVIPGDTQDDVYFIVNRTINGTTKRYIEMLAERDVSSKTSYWGVDCGATQTYSTATTTVSGLSWLEGKSVTVMADGVYVGKKTVSSGDIALDSAATTVTIGLGYGWELKTLQINAGIDRKKNISAVNISVVKSQGGEVSDSDSGPFNPLPYLTSGFYTGDLLDINLQSSYKYDGQITLKGKGVYPMHIVGISPKVMMGGS